MIVLGLLHKPNTRDQDIDRDSNTAHLESPDIHWRVAIKSVASGHQHNLNMRAEIRDKGLKFLNTEGNRVCLSREYTPASPLVEIIPMKRDINGQVSLLPVEVLFIGRADIESVSFSRDVYGTGLCLQISSQPLQDFHLLYDAEYEVAPGYIPAEGQDRIDAYDSKITFRTPDHLNDGEIYRVKLVLIDKIVDLHKAKVAKFKEEEKERIAKEEAIRIHVKYPEDVNADYLLASYVYDVGQKIGFDRGLTGELILPGPNPLNGELYVCFGRNQNDRNGWPWCYVANLSERTVDLPRDADVVIREKDFVVAYFDLEGQDRALAAGFIVLNYIFHLIQS